jgi:hypothetical protein
MPRTNGKGGLRLEHLCRIGAVEPGLCHRDGRQPGARAQRFDKAHLADRIFRVPLGLDIDRLLDPKPAAPCGT